DAAPRAYPAAEDHAARHLAAGTHAAIAKVIDVVDHAVAVADIAQRHHHRDDVVVVAAVLLEQLLRQHFVAAFEVLAVIEHAGAGDLVTADAAVELHAAHGGDVVTLLGKEEVVERSEERRVG